jgi:hypothetical protein
MTQTQLEMVKYYMTREYREMRINPSPILPFASVFLFTENGENKAISPPNMILLLQAAEKAGVKVKVKYHQNVKTEEKKEEDPKTEEPRKDEKKKSQWEFVIPRWLVMDIPLVIFLAIIYWFLTTVCGLDL